MSARGKPAKIEMVATLGVLSLHLGGEVVQAAHGTARRELAGDGGQQRRLAQGHRRPEAPLDHVEQAGGRLAAALRHVDVGIGLVAVQERGVAGHGRGDVGVQIQGGHDGKVGADHRAHRGEQIALSVLEPLGHHRPVKIEEDSVQGRRPGSGRRAVGALISA